MSFTGAALLNLYDFSQEQEIVNLAGRCLKKLLEDWVTVTNSVGLSPVVAGRTYQFYMYKGTGAVPSNLSRTYGFAHQEIMSLITGLGPLIVEGDYFNFAVYLTMSNFSLAEIAATYSPEVVFNESVHVGVGYEEGKEGLFSNLTAVDRYIAQMSMGGYANPEYVNDFFAFVDTFDMWNHHQFTSFKALRRFPDGVKKLLATIISSRGAASVLNVDWEFYKHHGISLSSLKDYFPGFKGYQQTPWVAGVGDVTTFTTSMADFGYNNSDFLAQTVNNDQLPLIEQQRYVALIMYNPNRDLPLLGIRTLEVVFHFDDINLHEVVDSNTSNWLFGRVDDSYVGVYRHCKGWRPDGVVRVCYDKQQVWVAVVGNNFTHGNFSEFVDGLSTVKVETSFRSRCISAALVIDDLEFDREFCRNFGKALTALLLIIFYLIVQCTCCFVCCRKKRKVWKTFVVTVSPFHEKKVNDEDEIKKLDMDTPEEEDFVETKASVSDNNDIENEKTDPVTETRLALA